jgi:cupin fold WbuC family metalloprotein
MTFYKIDDGVYYANDLPVKICQEDIFFLKESAQKTSRKRSRLCAHKDEFSPLHEMLIVQDKATYIRPHKHIGKSESFHIVEGEVDLILFEDNGELRDVVSLTDNRSKGYFYYRIDEPIFHSFHIRTDFLVFHETTNGPFVPEKTIFSEWSPVEGDQKGISDFLKDLQKRCEAFR